MTPYDIDWISFFLGVGAVIKVATWCGMFWLAKH